MNQGAGGGSGSLFQQLTTDDGAGLDLGRVATLVAGILATAWGSSVASFISAFYEAFVIGPLQGVASFISELTDAGTSGFEAVGDGVWQPLINFVQAFGPVAWIVAVIVVVALAYGAVKGWSLR